MIGDIAKECPHCGNKRAENKGVIDRIGQDVTLKLECKGCGAEHTTIIPLKALKYLSGRI